MALPTSRHTLALSALCSLALAAGFACSGLGCSGEEPVQGAVLDTPTPTSTQSGAAGRPAVDVCAGDARVEPGCPCPTPDAWIACGKVEQESGGYAFCADGFKLCVDGKWTPCEGKRIAVVPQ